MAEQYLASLIDPTRCISFDTAALLSSSTINALHFPGLSTSGISDSGVGSRTTSFLLDGIGMCESMTESFCSTGGQDDLISMNNSNIHPSDTSMTNVFKLDRKDSNAQKRRRSRKSIFDATIDGTSLDKIETVTVIDEQNEPDDAWLYEVPKNGHKNNQITDNIFSWVHKEFKTNDINASKHRLLCKLDDMSHAPTIRSVSCHNFADHQRSDSVKRNSAEHQINSEPVKNGRFSSPLRSTTPFRPSSPANLSPLRSTITTTNLNGNYANNSTVAAIIRSREASKERLDYTDVEVMAKLQLENLRQAERQGPLSKRFGGSNVSLASTSSGTSLSISNRPETKPPVAPKSTVTRNAVKSNTYRRANTQAITSNGHDTPVVAESKPSITLATRVSLLPPNSANNNRTRPPVARPIQPYRGSQTSYINNNNAKVQTAPSSIQRNGKKPINNFGSTFPSNENGLLNDVSNKPLTAPIRSQIGPQRRTIVPQSSTHSSVEQIPPSSSTDIITNGQTTTIPRGSSSLSQGRKSGIPMIGKQKSGTVTVTRPTSSKVYPSSQSSDSMMVTKTIRTACPQISESTSIWNEGCY